MPTFVYRIAYLIMPTHLLDLPEKVSRHAHDRICQLLTCKTCATEITTN